MKKFLKMMCVLSMLTLATHMIKAEGVTTPETPVDVSDYVQRYADGQRTFTYTYFVA